MEMDPSLTEVSQLFERFKAAFLRNDLDTCTNLLTQLKVLDKINPSFSVIFSSSSLRFSWQFVKFV